MNRECLAALVLFAVLTGLCGCGKELRPVGGTLVWEDGQPATELEGATLYFESTLGAFDRRHQTSHASGLTLVFALGCRG